jgi:hypothetical protein
MERRLRNHIGYGWLKQGMKVNEKGALPSSTPFPFENTRT